MNQPGRSTISEYGGLVAYLVPCSLVTVFAHVVLVPRFERLVEDFNAGIPPVLQGIITAIRFGLDHFWILVAVPVVVAVVGETCWPWWRTRRGVVFSVVKWLLVVTTMAGTVALATAALALVNG